MDINTSNCVVWVEKSGSFYHGFPWSSSGYQVEPSHFPCLVCLRNMKLVCTVGQNDVGWASSSDVIGRKGKPFSSLCSCLCLLTQAGFLEGFWEEEWCAHLCTAYWLSMMSRILWIYVIIKECRRHAPALKAFNDLVWVGRIGHLHRGMGVGTHIQEKRSPPVLTFLALLWFPESPTGFTGAYLVCPFIDCLVCSRLRAGCCVDIM